MPHKVVPVSAGNEQYLIKLREDGGIAGIQVKGSGKKLKCGWTIFGYVCETPQKDNVPLLLPIAKQVIFTFSQSPEDVDRISVKIIESSQEQEVAAMISMPATQADCSISLRDVGISAPSILSQPKSKQ